MQEISILVLMKVGKRIQSTAIARTPQLLTRRRTIGNVYVNVLRSVTYCSPKPQNPKNVLIKLLLNGTQN